MSNVTITLMTRELAHRVFDGCESDPMTYVNLKSFRPFVYTEKGVDEYLEKQKELNHILFAIMLCDTPIGEIKLHNISKKHQRCEISVHIKNDSYKNAGYGTEAVRQAISYAKDTLGMKTMQARTLFTNERSRRVLKKLGFLATYNEDKYLYFEKDLYRVEVIKPIKLVPMTRKLFHEFYNGYRYSYPPKGYRQNFREFKYEDDAIDAHYRLESMLNRYIFAITIDGKVVGKVKLTNVDFEKCYCCIECYMQSDEYKNRGYGSKAIIQTLKYAKNELGIQKVGAYVTVDNPRAQRVSEKIGFVAKDVIDYYGDNVIPYELSFY